MCGICGVMSTTFLVQKEVDIFNQLLYLSAFRGQDSTGMFSVEKKNNDWKPEEIVTKSFKNKVPAAFFLYQAEKAGMYKDNYKKRALVGHTRAATIGETSVNNAHPFEFDKVIGVHNGTIHSHFKHKKEFETDSEAVFKNINDYGIVETIQEISFAGSAYALVWYDKVNHTMNFIRNDQRPIYFTYADNKKLLLFASTRPMLEFVTQNLDIKPLSGWPKIDGDYFTLGENHHFSFPVLDVDDFSDPDIHEIKPRKNVYKYSGKKHIPWNNQPIKDYTPTDYHRDWMAEDLQEPFDAEFSTVAYVKGYRGEYINIKKFTGILEDGCCICGEYIDPKEKNVKDKVHWWDQDHVVCEGCYDNSDGGWVKETMFDSESPVDKIILN